ncbi:T-lymphocyte activation antigen CD80 [Callorhinus ursinus]|uniref:T-lymphocyte activation antigen CD80 n=2 Tax=Otariidae TaxID=9702 RepID=A0A3Q7PKE9_CALUR|nr:T-lymphocyte activation antigen CD80 [Callorhinus ursinus]XP_025730462.1 T-lymphocyte activation antigen CD80 [Callorhinus ursinus]XP_025730470.1 T-lymphocyte activation antigen CD80 [Callorhinus ursinus]XP_025730477.1 T-lymphocyte activation antigen CD80 [Callorhinus ursinus]XP_025730480.1 T-lymphocyte activation antigen CD80 [Callorhinus ursinus]XP_025730484.1 T-lymphocyte activation antigen CD80 [Callorhinus ursinus]XP_025730493.1 T-lymphocyte activation antigen CD80 [Callorhinus ursinu
MDHPAKWRTPLLEHLYLKLFQFLMLTSPFYFCSGIIQVNKTVKEVAVLSCDYNISTEELMKVRIYWQKDDEMVLAIMSGKEQVWSKYENRTFTDFTKNLSIVILALRLSDNGKYTCIVQKIEKGSYKVKHMTSVMLLVRADFPVPSITDLGNPSRNIKRIMCSTSGGFPKPHLSWLENEEELNAINTTVSQDPETELYTISSELDFNITNNHSFVCLVKYGDLAVSQIFNWQKFEPPPPDNSFLLWVIVVVSGIFVITVIKGICSAYRLAARCRRKRNEEGMDMEKITPINIGSAQASV